MHSNRCGPEKHSHDKNNSKDKDRSWYFLAVVLGNNQRRCNEAKGVECANRRMESNQGFVVILRGHAGSVLYPLDQEKRVSCGFGSINAM